MTIVTRFVINPALAGLITLISFAGPAAADGLRPGDRVTWHGHTDPHGPVLSGTVTGHMTGDVTGDVTVIELDSGAVVPISELAAAASIFAGCA